MSCDNIQRKLPEAASAKGEKVVRFELLGAFSHREIKNTGKKTLSFLQYLIVNHSRNISAEELIDTFWTEKNSKDPANALRNMLHKIRALLKAMFPEFNDMLQTYQGYYVWNPELRIELDIEQFEEACLKAKKYSREKCLELLRQAVYLYKGEFLSGNDSEWTKPLRQYYKTLYVDACKSLIPLLEEDEQWVEIVSVCSQAYQIDFCMEEFAAHKMQAYIAMGRPEQAVEVYESVKERMKKELGMPPTEHLESIYSLAVGLCKKGKWDEREIFRLVCEGKNDKRAFFCSFGMFQSIVALERRHLARSGLTSTLVLVSLGDDAAPTTDARRLEHILQEGLRTGDPVARLTAGSYIVMLTGTDTGNAQIVTSRIDSTFHKTYRRSDARLSFRISALYPEGIREKI